LLYHQILVSLIMLLKFFLKKKYFKQNLSFVNFILKEYLLLIKILKLSLIFPVPLIYDL